MHREREREIDVFVRSCFHSFIHCHCASTSAHPPVLLPTNAFSRYLTSYEHMGTALVECASGCTCASLEIQAHVMTYHSIEEVAAIYPSEAEECVIRVTNLNKTLSGENKFKLVYITVLAEPKRESEESEEGWK